MRLSEPISSTWLTCRGLFASGRVISTGVTRAIGRARRAAERIAVPERHASEDGRPLTESVVLQRASVACATEVLCRNEKSLVRLERDSAPGASRPCPTARKSLLRSTASFEWPRRGWPDDTCTCETAWKADGRTRAAASWRRPPLASRRCRPGTGGRPDLRTRSSRAPRCRPPAWRTRARLRLGRKPTRVRNARSRSCLPRRPRRWASRSGPEPVRPRWPVHTQHQRTAAVPKQ